MDSSTFSLDMLWSKQQLMKYLPLSCVCVRVCVHACVRAQSGDSSTPTHGHTHAYEMPGAPQKAKGVSASRLFANREAERSSGSGSTLLLNESHSCWYSYWWRGKKEKKLQSHLKFNRNVFVANGRDRGRKHFRLHSLLKRLFSPVAVVLGINTLWFLC